MVRYATYSFLLPVAFYPNYEKLGDFDPFPYQFAYSVVMKSTQKINLISKPANSILESDESGKYATLFCNKPDHEINVYFRTDEMKQPQLVYAKNPSFPNEVAYSVQFVPTFEPPMTSEEFELLDDEEPESTDLFLPENLHLNFLLDRSGSMSGNRIRKACEALVFFLRSLPEGCKFSVVSFGSNFEYLELKGNKILVCDEETIQGAIARIEKFDANLGGTEIAAPIKNIISTGNPDL